MSHPTLTGHAGPNGHLTVTVCGSFRRDLEGLRKACRELAAAGALVLSPLDLEFVDEHDGFLVAAHEVGRPPQAIEADHMRAMVAADFVWLHAPDGYVGASAAAELGFAHALGLPVYASADLSEPGLADLVRVVDGPVEAVSAQGSDSLASSAPTRGLDALQEYYARAARRRGWDDETPQQTLLLLLEEIGELAQALRRTQYGATSAGDENPALELADVALYVLHLANGLGIQLASAVSAKEAINARRFEAPVAQTAA